jgi:hypothetical protein
VSSDAAAAFFTTPNRLLPPFLPDPDEDKPTILVSSCHRISHRSRFVPIRFLGSLEDPLAWGGIGDDVCSCTCQLELPEDGDVFPRISSPFQMRLLEIILSLCSCIITSILSRFIFLYSSGSSRWPKATVELDIHMVRAGPLKLPLMLVRRRPANPASNPQ